jgi:hypothetical protein
VKYTMRAIYPHLFYKWTLLCFEVTVALGASVRV